MLTFKTMLMWLVTFIAVLIVSLLVGAIFSALLSEQERYKEDAPKFSWLLTSLLLSVTCVMLAYS